MNNEFSENIKKIRKENHLSQEQLAEELGVSRQSISKWESGAAYPEMDKIIYICKKYNVNIDDLLHYQNKTGDNNFKKKKTPFYFYLRTVNNPFDKKYLVKKGLPGSFRIKFCDLKFI